MTEVSALSSQLSSERRFLGTAVMAAKSRGLVSFTTLSWGQQFGRFRAGSLARISLHIEREDSKFQCLRRRG